MCRFLFQINEEYKPDVMELIKYLRWKKIEDEYCHKISRGDFVRMIMVKQNGQRNELCNITDRYGYEWTTTEFS